MANTPVVRAAEGEGFKDFHVANRVKWVWDARDFWAGCGHFWHLHQHELEKARKTVLGEQFRGFSMSVFSFLGVEVFVPINEALNCIISGYRPFSVNPV